MRHQGQACAQDSIDPCVVQDMHSVTWPGSGIAQARFRAACRFDAAANTTNITIIGMALTILLFIAHNHTPNRGGCQR